MMGIHHEPHRCCLPVCPGGLTCSMSNRRNPASSQRMARLESDEIGRKTYLQGTRELCSSFCGPGAAVRQEQRPNTTSAFTRTIRAQHDHRSGGIVNGDPRAHVCLQSRQQFSVGMRPCPSRAIAKSQKQDLGKADKTETRPALRLITLQYKHPIPMTPWQPTSRRKSKRWSWPRPASANSNVPLVATHRRLFAH